MSKNRDRMLVCAELTAKNPLVASLSTKQRLLFDHFVIYTNSITKASEII
jgi:hypothetical protein